MKYINIVILFVGLFLVTSCNEDPCDAVVCYNGGVCINGNCDCPPGFTGSSCENEDECNGVVCLNGGECINGICDCLLGYIGPDCSDFDESIEICIESVLVSGYPTSINGAAWDDPTFGSSTGPDVSFHIYNPNGSDLISTLYFPDATGSTLNFNSQFPFCRSGSYWDNDIAFSLYDLDDLDLSDVGSANDFMTGFTFNLWDRLSYADYPSTHTVNSSNSNLSMTFTLSYD